jgi:chloramphenicol-sensitive protein RarD
VEDVAARPDERSGLGFGVSAYLLWGLFPLYWPLLKPASALEILAHRMLWSLVFVVGLLAVRRQLGSVRALAADRRKLLLLTAAAVFVSVNWGVYIWGVNHGHVVETSLGYFINPLITILVGVIVLKERLRPAQWVAVGIASLAIVVLTIDYGRLPWIALTLACTFATYGFLKKRVSSGAVESLTIETAVLALPAIGILLAINAQTGLAFGHHSAANTLLLAGTGVVTAIPLIFFGAAASRLPLTTIGLLQYMTPVIQFTLGVTVRHESMPLARWAGFTLVWIALVVLTVENVRHQRRATVPDTDAVEAAIV